MGKKYVGSNRSLYDARPADPSKGPQFGQRIYCSGMMSSQEYAAVQSMRFMLLMLWESAFNSKLSGAEIVK